ncbi:MAG TPA: hypothetical protein VD866_05680, partial [Urbifossiella sp.]|nr:hypothetical protein [Urbifossiella sp.]
GWCDWVTIRALQQTYERAVVDVRHDGNTFTGTTTNVRRLRLDPADPKAPIRVTLDGQDLALPQGFVLPPPFHYEFERTGTRWALDFPRPGVDGRLEKRVDLQGPIDDAFASAFEVTAPSAPGWHAATDRHAKAADAGFDKLWDRYFRGALPRPGKARRPEWFQVPPHEVMFGDPASNPKIAAVLPKLPITWTKEKLVMNGAEYDAATHLPVLIYPHPTTGSYVVLNSGHTFGEADLKGTNALLYPRLGDWAVIRPAPTPRDPAAYEVVAAGLFDENWQFPKK